MNSIPAGGDHFIIRRTKTIHFASDGPPAEGVDARGRRWTDRTGLLGAVRNPERRLVRNVTLHRAGEEDVTILTDLVDPAAFPAEQLLDAYLRRGGIEQVF